MGKFLPGFAVAIVSAIAVVLALAASKPNDFRIQSSVSIRATPGKILPFIDNFHNWPLWSPYEAMDHNMKRTYSGAAKGLGAVYEWEGNARAGKGRMEIIGETPNKVVIKLNFYKPIEAENTAEFTLVPKGDSTVVTWVMYVKNTFKAKIFYVFVDMNIMLTRDFDKGLVKMKEKIEKK